MAKWQNVYYFTYPHEAHLVRTKLESEGIEVIILDEETIQAINIYSDAMGGIRLQVQTKDIQRTEEILKTFGYNIDHKKTSPIILNGINFISKYFPFLKHMKFEFRLLLLLLLLVIILVFIVLILNYLIIT